MRLPVLLLALAAAAALAGSAAGSHAAAARTHAARSSAAAPRAVVLTGPAQQVRSRVAPVTFGITPAGAAATTQCSLDGAPFAPCSSPRTYHGLALGEHTFAVQAAGADTAPASIAWTILPGSDAEATATPVTVVYGTMAGAGAAAAPKTPGPAGVASLKGGAAAAPAATTTAAKSGSALKPTAVSGVALLSRYGAVGDGVHDDAPALAAAIASVIAGTTIEGDAGKTYLLGSTVVVDRRVTIDLNGGVLRKADSLGGPALWVTSPNVTIRKLELDGAHAAGDGIWWEALGGRLESSTVHDTSGTGVLVQAGRTASVLTAIGVRSDDNVGPGENVGHGFYAGPGTTLNTDAACSASGNGYSGWKIGKGGSGSINGVASRNFVGFAIYGNSGTSTTISGEGNLKFGLVLDYKASGWRFGKVAFARLGDPAIASTGTGVEIYGGSDNRISSVAITASTGYGVALSRDRDGNQPRLNRIGTVLVDATGAGDSDPAIHLSGGATDNSFESVTAIGTPSAVSIGEDTDPRNNDRNRITKLRAVNNAYCVLCIKGGSANVFASVTVVNAGTVDSRIATGIVELNSSKGPVRGNSITMAVSSFAGSASYAVHADRGSTGNAVTITTLARTRKGLFRDENGRNTLKAVAKAG